MLMPRLSTASGCGGELFTHSGEAADVAEKNSDVLFTPFKSTISDRVFALYLLSGSRWWFGPTDGALPADAAGSEYRAQGGAAVGTSLQAAW